jgi:antitoxin (DNA-binding transcriptional repressor) of toxin-antitoxin stability system
VPGFHEVSSDAIDVAELLDRVRRGEHTLIRDAGGRPLAAVVPAAEIAERARTSSARTLTETTTVTVRRELSPAGVGWWEVRPVDDPDPAGG